MNHVNTLYRIPDGVSFEEATVVMTSGTATINRGTVGAATGTDTRLIEMGKDSNSATGTINLNGGGSASVSATVSLLGVMAWWTVSPQAAAIRIADWMANVLNTLMAALAGRRGEADLSSLPWKADRVVVAEPVYDGGDLVGAVVGATVVVPSYGDDLNLGDRSGSLNDRYEQAVEEVAAQEAGGATPATRGVTRVIPSSGQRSTLDCGTSSISGVGSPARSARVRGVVPVSWKPR